MTCYYLGMEHHIFIYYIPYNNSQYSDHIIRAKIKTDYDKRYVKYCLEKSIETERVDVVSLATWSVSIWNEQRIVVPPLEEQIEIADYLDEKLAIINEIIDKKQLQLEKIKSNKSSLIYEYVTGKKRVKVGG